jgi:peptide/nickel transport system substrate-binding protein
VRETDAQLSAGTTRRRLLYLLSLGGVGSLLASCTPPPGANATQSPTVVAAPPTLAAASSTAGAPAAGANAVVAATNAEAGTFNPLLSSDGASLIIQAPMFEGLVKADPKSGAAVPWLAERWEQSPDGLSYTFHLRPNVVWSDGQPFTAADVRFTFEAILDPRTHTSLRSGLDNVASLDAPDPSTFSVTLKQPDCPFQAGAMLTPIVPRHILESSADLNTDEFGINRPIGTGPYVFKEWLKDDHVTLVANPSYWRGKPKIEQWIRKVITDTNVRAAQLKSGEVDLATMEPETGGPLKDEAHLNVFAFLANNLTHIFYNLDRPFFQDKRVRQALTYALDREMIVKTLIGADAAVTPVPMTPASWAYNTNIKPYPYDPAFARKLLSDAGWAPGPDGVLVTDGQPLSFTLTTNGGNKGREGALTVAQDQWQKVGVKIQPELLQVQVLNDRYQRAHTFDAVLTRESIGSDPDQTVRWASKSYPGGENFVHFSNPEVDRLLEQARVAPGCDQAARKALYDRFQEIMVDEQPALFFFQAQTLLVSKKSLGGVTTSLWNQFTASAADWTWQSAS